MTKTTSEKEEEFNSKMPVLQIKARGWTDSAIRKFLGSEDSQATNPIFRSGPPVRLYLKSRIIEAEQTDEWKTWREKSEKRRQSAKAASETKRNKLLEEIRSIEIQYDWPKDLKQAMLEACGHYNSRINYYNYSGDVASLKSDKSFLHRITVNYLRHVCAEYDENLGFIFGRVGTNLAYLEIKRRIHSAISERFPKLAKECKRQIEEYGEQTVEE